MALTLSPELEARVNQKVADGLYRSTAQVVEEALRLLEERDRDRQARLEELRHQIALGLEQLDRGNSRPFDEEAVKRVIARGRQRLAEEQERSE